MSLQQITKYYKILSADTFFQGKVSANTFFSEESGRGHFFLKVSADTVSGFLDGAEIGIKIFSSLSSISSAKSFYEEMLLGQFRKEVTSILENFLTI